MAYLQNILNPEVTSPVYIYSTGIEVASPPLAGSTYTGFPQNSLDQTTGTDIEYAAVPSEGAAPFGNEGLEGKHVEKLKNLLEKKGDSVVKSMRALFYTQRIGEDWSVIKKRKHQVSGDTARKYIVECRKHKGWEAWRKYVEENKLNEGWAHPNLPEKLVPKKKRT